MLSSAKTLGLAPRGDVLDRAEEAVDLAGGITGGAPADVRCFSDTWLTFIRRAAAANTSTAKPVSCWSSSRNE